jgi:hypothetical protein
MNQNRKLTCIMVGAAIVTFAQVLHAIKPTCNGQAACQDENTMDPSPCTPLYASCSGYEYDPNPCSDCGDGGASDYCIVIAETPGTVTPYSGGKCDGNGNCNSPAYGQASPTACWTLQVAKNGCIPE